MINGLSVFFALLTLLSIYLFWRATGKNKVFLLIVSVMVITQTIITLSGFYKNITALPPRILLQPVPALLIVFSVFIMPRGRRWIDTANMAGLTLLHTIRIGAEVTIYGLIIAGLMPEILSVGGRNFDILAGITAPLVHYFVFVRKVFGRKLLLVWNVLCLGLLLNVVIHAALAVPSPVQQFGLSQPNVAILRFPFSYLPSVVVPIVMFSHLIVIRNLWKTEDSKPEVQPG
jgi:hypothetical protein